MTAGDQNKFVVDSVLQLSKDLFVPKEPKDKVYGQSDERATKRDSDEGEHLRFERRLQMENAVKSESFVLSD